MALEPVAVRVAYPYRGDRARKAGMTGAEFVDATYAGAQRMKAIEQRQEAERMQRTKEAMKAASPAAKKVQTVATVLSWFFCANQKPTRYYGRSEV